MRHELRKLNKRITRLENRQRKEMIALKSEILSAMTYSLPFTDGQGQTWMTVTAKGRTWHQRVDPVERVE
ncbi:MAG: hypothetical protein PHS14_18850 [Elusimicrobia bacterium]|nr:hypothetical protein [Elusimicrobiota bacterium]